LRKAALISALLEPGCTPSTACGSAMSDGARHGQGSSTAAEPVRAGGAANAQPVRATARPGQFVLRLSRLAAGAERWRLRKKRRQGSRHRFSLAQQRVQWV
jgi:hypothetical protein